MLSVLSVSFVPNIQLNISSFKQTNGSFKQPNGSYKQPNDLPNLSEKFMNSYSVFAPLLFFKLNYSGYAFNPLVVSLVELGIVMFLLLLIFWLGAI